MSEPQEDWPSPLLWKLSKRFYEEMLNSFPTPEDIPWEKLDEHDQEAYAFAINATIKLYCSETGLPVRAL